MASANTSEKVPPDKVQEKQKDKAEVKRAPQEESTEIVAPPAKRMRHDSEEPAMLTESPLETTTTPTTPPSSPAHSTASLPPAEIPPAPPSTPASVTDTFHPPHHYASVDSLPGIVENAAALEAQQLLSEDTVATPAPTTSTRAAAPHLLKDDFSDWAVGERYQLLRMLGRGSYGEVAQAKDLMRGDAFVAIKRITSAFDQEVDAIRLYREMHILRGLRGHECIIQLLDVVQPPSEDLNDFHDLYLVFECK